MSHPSLTAPESVPFADSQIENQPTVIVSTDPVSGATGIRERGTALPARTSRVAPVGRGPDSWPRLLRGSPPSDGWQALTQVLHSTIVTLTPRAGHVAGPRPPWTRRPSKTESSSLL